MTAVRLARAVHLILAVSCGAVVGPAWAQEGALETAEQVPAGVLETVEVSARQRAAAAGVVRERIEQPVVADFLDAEQITRVGDSSVSLALRRLPGVTLVSDQFIYVRGLGERYSSTTLNGAGVPSPDLSRNTIPLDLFPAAIIESLAVVKGYTVERPAAFGGGNVDIRTRSIPERPVFSIELGSGTNSDGSDDGWTYPGGGDDWLGTDDGTRALPDALRSAVQTYQGDISPANILQGLRRDGGSYTIADAQAVNREIATALNRDIEFQRTSLDPDMSVEMVAGDSWALDGEERWRLGALGLVDYGNQWRNRERTTTSQQFPETTFTETQQTVNQVSLTGSLSTGLQYLDDHRVDVSGLYLRNTDDEASLALRSNNNFSRADGLGLREYRIRYEERSLELFQLRGSHALGNDSLALLGNRSVLEPLRDLRFTWYYSEATAQTEIPNEILVSAEDRLDENGELLSTALRASNSGTEFRFTDLVDEVRSHGGELSKPFEIGDSTLELAGGWAYYEKGRRYLQTQLGLGTQAIGTDAVRAGTPGQVLTDANILDAANGFQLSIGGTGTESYLAAELVHAGYGEVDLKWSDAWRVTGGARYEQFERVSVPVDPLEFDVSVGKIPLSPEQLESVAFQEDDIYPSFALTYSRRDLWAKEFQLRFGFSGTTARPDLREVSNATYIDPLTDARVRGNPALVNSALTNFDVRAEWFFDGGDNFTVSGFYKEIADPIETVQGAGSDDILAITFINAESAELYGVEFEWLKGDPLGSWMGSWADTLFVGGNLTLSDSKIRIGGQALNVTNDERRLSQHSQYVLNLQLGYDAPTGRHGATLVYNVFGERVFYAGVNGAADAYEQPFHSLDLVYTFYPTESFTLKLRLQNLLDEDLQITQGGVDVLTQGVGTTFKLDAALKF